MEETPQIAGAESLVAVLGYWPTFHDADVVEIKLERHSHDEGQSGPTLEALIHVIDFETSGRIGPDGRHALRHSVLVRLRFHEVAELNLVGFHPQNKLHELAITGIRGWQWERASWSIRFDSTLGVNATFLCHSVEVVSVVPCDRNGQP